MRQQTTIDKINDVMSELNEDERHVLLVIAQRLRTGRTAYGGLALGTDRRNMNHEAHEELLDATVYLAMATAKARLL